MPGNRKIEGGVPAPVGGEGGDGGMASAAEWHGLLRGGSPLQISGAAPTPEKRLSTLPDDFLEAGDARAP